MQPYLDWQNAILLSHMHFSPLRGHHFTHVGSFRFFSVFILARLFSFLFSYISYLCPSFMSLDRLCSSLSLISHIFFIIFWSPLSRSPPIFIFLLSYGLRESTSRRTSSDRRRLPPPKLIPKPPEGHPDGTRTAPERTTVSILFPLRFYSDASQSVEAKKVSSAYRNGTSPCIFQILFPLGEIVLSLIRLRRVFS
mgnify:CR=1 FL=1